MATAIQEESIGMSRAAILRDSIRYVPVRRDACVSWWGEPDEFDDLDDLDPDATVEFGAMTFEARSCHRFALLLDIGLTGASLVVDDLPQDDQMIWFRLAGDRPGEWAGADIVEAMTTARGPHVLRIAFRDSCPFEVLREAVGG